jgi:signal transduction histidine kinase
MARMLAFITSRFSHGGKAAALQERRRIARDLHDGLAQELAFVVLQSRRLAQTSADSGLAELVDAAERALAETRTVITSLTAPADGQELERTAKRIAQRSGASVELSVAPSVELAPERRYGLLRIMQEAMSNGLRHGKADNFVVELTSEKVLRFRITDNGDGFDDSRPGSPTSFGLASMKERARELGGELTVRSQPGGGTAVEVALP